MTQPLVISTIPGPTPDLEERVETLEEKVQSLECQMETLTEQYESLQQRVTELEEALDDLLNHTHTYLTGEGEGHNNTQATTGPPSTSGE